MKFLNHMHNTLTVHFHKGEKYVPLETEFESFIFEFELLNLNNFIKN